MLSTLYSSIGIVFDFFLNSSVFWSGILMDSSRVYVATTLAALYDERLFGNGIHVANSWEGRTLFS